MNPRQSAIVERLRGGDVITAELLADAFSVSMRTIYRDVVAIQRAGVPIDGRAGLGYRIDPEAPLAVGQLTIRQLQALVAAATCGLAETPDPVAAAGAIDQLAGRIPPALWAIPAEAA